MPLIMLKKAIYALKYAASVHGDRALESSSIAFCDHLIIHKGTRRCRNVANTPFALVCSLYTQNGEGLLVAGVHMLFVRPNMLNHCSSPPMLLLMLKKADYAISNASRMGQSLSSRNPNHMRFALKKRGVFFR